MNQPETLLEVEIPASQVIDLSTFEENRTEAYDQTDPDRRKDALNRLVDGAKVVGDVSMADVVLETVTEPDEINAEEQARRAMSTLEKVSDAVATEETHRKHTEDTYRIQIDEGGEVVGVLKIVPTPQDKKATSRARSVSDRTGWGPKQNSSSFRLNKI